MFFTFNGITTPLEHWHYETFSGGKAEDKTFNNMKLTFRTDVNGNVAEITAPFEPFLDEIIFKKKPDARFFDPEYLKRFTGKYKILNQVFTVSLKGNTLTIYIPGQQVFDLVPERGEEFSLKGVSIINLKFIQDKKGNVTGLEFYQPDGVYEAKRIK